MASPIIASDSQPAKTAFSYRHLLLLAGFAMVFVLFFYRLGSYPLFDMDEPRYAEAAREMIERNNWITPYFNYELRFDKPVFFYWLVAFSYRLFGTSEFSARLVSALMATGNVALLYWFGRRWVSVRYGLFSALILATAIMFIGLARMSITDMTLTFFMTATMLCLFMAAHANLRWWLAAGLFAGLGILTKGPVALVIPGAVFTLYTVAIGDWKRCLLNRWFPLGSLLCLLTALPWYVAAYLQNGYIFLDALFLHNLTRYSDVVSGHKQPAYFYVIVLLAGFLPWTAYLPAAVKRLWGEIRTGHRGLVAERNYPYLVALYGAIWTVFVFLFFTVSNTKLLTYILPLFPGLTLWVSETWYAESRSSVETNVPPLRWMTVPAWIMVAVAAVLGGLFITNMSSLLPREAEGIVSNTYNYLAVAVLLAGTVGTAWLLTRKSAAAALALQALSMVLVVGIAMQGVIPNISRVTQGTMMAFARRVNDKPVILYEIQRPSLTFYTRQKVPRYVAKDKNEMLRELNKNPRTFVITKNKHLSTFYSLLPETMRVEILEKDSVYSLLSVSSASAARASRASLQLPKMEAQP